MWRVEEVQVEEQEGQREVEQEEGHLGRMPRLIMTSIGGFLSLLRIFLADWVACSCRGPSEP